jgi:hypothetical protein
MVPRAHTIVGLLLLGIVANILIAWACEAFCSTECVDLSGNALRTRRPAEVDGTWQSAAAVQEARGLGRTTIWYMQGSIGDVGIHKAGWPFRALQYQINDRPGQANGFRGTHQRPPPRLRLSGRSLFRTVPSSRVGSRTGSFRSGPSRSDSH